MHDEAVTDLDDDILQMMGNATHFLLLQSTAAAITYSGSKKCEQFLLKYQVSVVKIKIRPQ